jgi:hypothetical protein
MTDSAHRQDISIEYGYREEWFAFAARHPEFTKRFGNLAKAIDVAFQRTHHTTGPMERTVYFLGRIAVEEFMELLLLCANGYGIGAQKLLRGLYERAVTAKYLFKHPGEVDKFLAYHRVTDHKLLTAIQSSMGHDVFTPEQVEKIRHDFEQVKANFMIPDCTVCKTTRLNHTWSRKDVVSMARESGDLWPLIVPAYYLPTREFHTTMGAIFSRLDPEAVAKGEGLMFDGAAQRDRADQALVAAYPVLLNVVHLQLECFQIRELEPLMQTCFEDFREILKQENKPKEGINSTAEITKMLPDSDKTKLKFELANKNMQSIGRAQGLYVTALLTYICLVWAVLFVGTNDVSIHLGWIDLKVGGIWRITPIVLLVLTLAYIGSLTAAMPALAQLRSVEKDLFGAHEHSLFEIDTHKNLIDYVARLQLNPFGKTRMPKDETGEESILQRTPHLILPTMFIGSAFTSFWAIHQLSKNSTPGQSHWFFIFDWTCFGLQVLFSLRPTRRCVWRFFGAKRTSDAYN